MWSDAIFFTLKELPYDVMTTFAFGLTMLGAGACIGLGVALVLAGKHDVRTDA